ncbi:hypothetical protein NC653_039658 [Populus alba x Populus x berolinensis]|uniref:Uncharacterized protein n=1 Tax=Populus alba x Populus x berolinensis TaxID=444605 RepID=A0AAD6PQW0_9ROSI|nr:hypothetical protein NC653_039658 [Populus alba x Populus x berolinensis]
MKSSLHLFFSLFFLLDEAGAHKTLTYVLVFASHELISQLNNDTHIWRILCLYFMIDLIGPIILIGTCDVQVPFYFKNCIDVITKINCVLFFF